MASKSLDAQLRFAIANKRLIHVGYNRSVRVAEPHDYGVQKGTTKLLIFQVRASGGSQQKSATGWRLLDVSKIESCEVLDDMFAGSRGQSHQRHCEWDEIYARVG